MLSSIYMWFTLIFLGSLIFPFSANAIEPSGITGTFVWHQNINEAEVAPLIDEIAGLQMDTIIIARTRSRQSPCADNNYIWENYSVIPKILEEAQKHQIGVYIGLSTAYPACPDIFDNPLIAEQEATDMGNTVEHFLTTYPQYLSTIKGWYIPNEPSLAWHTDQTKLDNLYYYFQTVTQKIDSHQNPDLPTIVSPILAGTNNRSPDIIAQRALELKNHGIDIQAWQDSEGTYSTPLDWTRASPPTYQLRDYFSAISAAISPQSFWADIEIFSCTFPESNPWALGGCKDDWRLSNRPASISRITNQIKHAQSASKRVVWLQHTQMGQTDDQRQSDAPRLYNSYQAINNLSDLVYITPQSYQWRTPPITNYPDSGNELFNRLTADPRNYFNPQWVGIGGTARVTIDLGSNRPIRWIATHLLHYQSVGIAFPDSLNVRCSQDNTTWTDLGSWPFTLPKKTADYVFSNPEPLSANCRYLDITLPNSKITFISEIEIVGQDPNPTPSVLADANSDSLVNIVDFAIWRTEFNSQQPTLLADFNQDGIVNLTDFAIWKIEYLKTLAH